jgi:hypothetical protein
MKRETAAFVCSHVFEKVRPVLLVIREVGDWQYLCGGRHGGEEDFHVIGAEHLLEHDPTLSEVLDLDDNNEAERSIVGAPWTRKPYVAD